MFNKKPTEYLASELDEGFPALMTELVRSCSKLFYLPPFKVNALLDENDSVACDPIYGHEIDAKREGLLGGKQSLTKH